MVERSVAELNVEKDHFFQHMVDHADVPMFVYEQDRFVYVNKAALHETGYSRDEFLAFKYWEILHPDDQPVARERAKARQRGEFIPVSLEVRVMKKDSAVLWVRYQIKATEFQGHMMMVGIVIKVDRIQSTKVMYNTLFENDFAANMMLKDNRFLDCNAEALRLFGYVEKSEFCNLHPGQVSPPYQANGVDSLTAANDCIAIALERGFHRFEWLHMKQDGQVFEAEVLLRPMQVDHQTIIHAMVVDISERKCRERELEHRIVVEQALAVASSALISSAQPDIDQVLKTLVEALDVDRAYVFQMRIDDMQRMDNTFEWCAAGVTAEIDNLQNLNVAFFPWWIAQMRQGDLVNVSSVADLPIEAAAEKGVLEAQGIQAVLAVPLLTLEGVLLGFVGFDDVRAKRVWAVEDIRVLKVITEMISATLQRKQMLETLRQREYSMLKAQEIAHMGDWCFNVKYPELSDVSNETFRILGVPIDCTPSYGLFMRCIHRDDRVKVSKQVHATYAGEAFNNFRYRVVRPDGEVGHVQANGEAQVNEQSGQVERIYGTVQDITAQVDMEKMQEQVKTAKAESKAKGEFLAVMSHELRTPLHGIIGLQDMLAKELVDITGEQRERLALAQHSARVLSSLIDDILDLSKIESGAMHLQEGEFDMQALLHDVLLSFLPSAQQKGIELELALDEVPAFVFGDATKVRQVLLNIVGNAVKFTDQGCIRVHASYAYRHDDGYLCLDISDTGVGIAEDYLAQLFQPFKQFGHQDVRKGTGLGTTIALKFVQLMGGDIRVQSELGKGTSFIIHMRMQAQTDERISQCLDMNTCRMSPQLEKPDKVGLQGLKVLLAEDDPIARFIAIENLQGCGLQVDVADNGLLAWEKVQSKPYDVLLTDIRMPGIDGIELVQHIRALEKERSLNQTTARKMIIIGLSAHAMSHVETEAYAAGMDDFIAKPIDADTLIQRLMSMVDA